LTSGDGGNNCKSRLRWRWSQPLADSFMNI